MHETFDISFLDELGDEVSQSQIKAEVNITPELETNALENFRYPPPLSYFGASVREALNETLPMTKSDTSTQKVLENLSEKSYAKYTNAYEVFKVWQELNEVNSFAEPVLLDYFREMSMKYKPKSLWNLYTMLKTTILCRHNINISEYGQLLAFLKSYLCERQKSKVFTADDVNKFLVEAPEYKYLAMKAVCVFGVIAACRGEKITNVLTDYVKDNGNEIILSIPDAKSKVVKPYIIDGKFAEIVRKYMKLRPITAASTDRFFIKYQNGKCLNQAIGRMSILRMPKEIAKFLKLPESEAYTGYSFRRISRTFSADTGVGIDEGNVQEFLAHKREIGMFIAEEVDLPSMRNVIIASHENTSERIVNVSITSSESSSFEQEEIFDDPLSLSQRAATTGTSDNSSSSENEEPKRKRKKRPKRQKEINWYDEECQVQIKLTTDMFKRFSKMGEDIKMKMLSEFSMNRVELFKKYFAAMNSAVAINTSTTAASISSTQSGGVANPAFAIINVNSLANTNGINKLEPHV